MKDIVSRRELLDTELDAKLDLMIFQLRSNLMKTAFTTLGALVGAMLFMSALPLSAHHAFSAEFDRETPVKITGTVSKIEWTNPHIWIYVDTKDADGKTVTWALQGGPPSYLTRAGWNKNDLKLGTTITAQGFKAKDGSNNAAAGAITLPDGRRMFTLQIEGVTPPPPAADGNEKK